MSISAIDSRNKFVGPLADRLADWPNDDLLIEANSRAFFYRNYERFAHLFDWPELRVLFIEHEKIANLARRRSRRYGLLAVGSGFLGLIVTALSPLVVVLAATSFKSTAAEIVGVLAAAFAACGTLLGFSEFLTGDIKMGWIGNRVWAERIRQFHFQLLINNFESAVRSVSVLGARGDWLSFRAQQLDKLLHEYMAPANDLLRNLESDQAEDRPWLSHVWAHPGPTPSESPDLEELLQLLHMQRFGIQLRYVSRKLQEGWHSPKSRSRWLAEASNVLTILVLVCAMASGIVYIVSGTGGSLVASAIAALGGVVGAAVITLRVLDAGLQMTAEAERYEWYLATLKSLNRRFDRADSTERVSLLRELESVAYEETRRFVVSMQQAAFLI